MSRDIAGDLAAAGRMTDMDRVPEIERRRQFGDVGGIGVHLVAGRGLAGPAVAAAVMRDDPVALVQEEQHLVVPVVGAQRPAVVEDDGLTGAPVLVENLSTVLGRDHAHRVFLGLMVGLRFDFRLFRRCRRCDAHE